MGQSADKAGTDAPRRMGWLGRVLAALVLAFAIAGPAAALPEAFDIVVKQVDTPSSTVWRVETPNVKRSHTDYPTITFAPGDTVSIDAGGCVQTGGFRNTWKRYVNPTGGGSDQRYHGLISIPGLTNGMVRLQDFGLNKVYQIPKTLPPGVNAVNLRLTLGYEDDQYDDNGYYNHDDGDDDQCKNSTNAFVIISVGHAGAQPVIPSSFAGITPDRFRCEAGWAFHNFDTASLSWESFKDAFTLNWWDYLDPTTYIWFLAERDSLAASGNCMGMALIADVGEDQFLVDDLHESLTTNYPDKDVTSPRIVKDINVAHWRQLSVAFLQAYFATWHLSPLLVSAKIEADLTRANYNYGMIVLSHGSDGHIMVPLRVSRAGNQTFIDVYDPNRPCGGPNTPEYYPQITIHGDNWSYYLGGSETWTGTGDTDQLAYVPYVGSDEWSDFGANISGILEVIFGGDAKVVQVTDSRGRKLFSEVDGKVDASESGLGRSVLRLPSFHQLADRRSAALPTATLSGLSPPPRPARPRSGQARFTTRSTGPAPAGFDAFAARMEREYAADYARSSSIFLVKDMNLADLTFIVQSRDGTRSLRAMVHQNHQFIEVKLPSSTTTKAGMALTIHKAGALAQSGLNVRSLDQRPAQATITFGEASRQGVRSEHTDAITLGAGMEVSAPDHQVRLSGGGGLSDVRITEERYEATGAHSVTSRALRLTTLPAAIPH